MYGTEGDSPSLCSEKWRWGNRSQLGPRGCKNKRGSSPESVLGQSDGSLDIGASFLEASFGLRYRCPFPYPQLGKTEEGRAKLNTRQDLMAESLECQGFIRNSAAMEDLRRSWHRHFPGHSWTLGRDDTGEH